MLTLPALGLLLQNCSTKKNNVVTRSYHNLTARYNGYYYAGEIIKETQQKLEATVQDDYTKVLPLFIYPDDKTAKTLYPELDKAIKKTSLVISRHTITDRKGREIPGAVKWIDNNYMLLGKAHFYKRDFFSALESFDYVAKTYKKDNNRFAATLWLIRTYNETGSLFRSEPLISLLNNESTFPGKLRGEFAAVSADLYIRSEKYSQAIKELSKAIALSKRKKTRARYTYVLAQLYEKQGEPKKASNYYNRAIKLKPSYEMVFNAKMRRAALVSSETGTREMRKELTKMLKDAKNKEYLDQIYYALAQIEEKEKNTIKTIELLKLSTASSTGNINQKSLSYLKLADIYFDKPDYKNAQAYYDSVATIVPKDFPNREAIINKKQSLGDLVNNLNIIALEDSLQRLAKLSPAEREKIADTIIARNARETQLKKEKQSTEAQSPPAGSGPSLTSPQQTSGQQGSWYFYSQTTIAFGISEFSRKWGDRTLEDNWRRRSKEASFSGETEEGMSTEDTLGRGQNRQVAANRTGVTKETLLKQIPLTAQQLEKSNSRILESYYSLGSIYKDELQDPESASESFEALLTRFPENKHKLSSYYSLYRLYLSLNNAERAEYYKNKLLKDYPDTEYARLIKDPDYSKESKANKSVVEEFYNETYSAFLNGNYSDVIRRAAIADSNYTKNYLMPKFDFLKAISIGKTRDVKSFENALTSVTLKHPKDEVATRARLMLDALRNSQMPDSLKTKAEEKNQLYNFDKNAEHYIAVIVLDKKTDMNAFKIGISDFNTEFYGNETYNITSVLLNTEDQIVLVKKFEGADKAMSYLNTLTDNPKVFEKITNGMFRVFAISADNYIKFYKDKNLDTYNEFYKENYLRE